MDDRWVVAVKFSHAPLGFLGSGTRVPLKDAWVYSSEEQAALAAHWRFMKNMYGLPVFKPITYEDAVVLVTTQEINHGR